MLIATLVQGHTRGVGVQLAEARGAVWPAELVMVMVALVSLGALRFQVAEPSNCALLPSTATVLPT